MTDPTERMAEQLRDLDRRLRALETGQRGPSTSIQGGAMRVLTADAEHPSLSYGSAFEGSDDIALVVTNEDGTPCIEIGTSGGRARVVLINPDNTGAVVAYTDGQLQAPLPACSWQRFVGAPMDAVGMSTTNSATYVDLWYAALALGDDQIHGAIDVVPDGGVTGDVKIVAQVAAGVLITAKSPNGTPQQVVEQTGINTSTVVTGPWTVPETIWIPTSSPAGALTLFTIQARVTAGAGSIHVAPRWPAFCT